MNLYLELCSDDAGYYVGNDFYNIEERIYTIKDCDDIIEMLRTIEGNIKEIKEAIEND